MIPYTMFRDEIGYIDRIDRITAALVGIGCKIYNFDPNDLIISIKINGLEELMLATWSMNKYIRDYLKNINSGYEPGHKVGDLYTAVGRLIKYCQPIPDGKYYYVSDEAEDMERVSRACYAWMKNFRMLKNQKTNFDWAMMH